MATPAYLWQPCSYRHCPKETPMARTQGWLRSPCTGIASLPMTYFYFFVIANPACWLRQGVKRSPARRTRTGSIRSHTRRGQLRNPPTNHASLSVTIIFPVLSFQLHAFSWKWHYSPWRSVFYFVIFTPCIFVKMVPLAVTIIFPVMSSQLQAFCKMYLFAMKIDSDLLIPSYPQLR